MTLGDTVAVVRTPVVPLEVERVEMKGGSAIVPGDPVAGLGTTYYVPLGRGARGEDAHWYSNTWRWICERDALDRLTVQDGHEN
jgi:hypothetical protein